MMGVIAANGEEKKDYRQRYLFKQSLPKCIVLGTEEPLPRTAHAFYVFAYLFMYVLHS